MTNAACGTDGKGVVGPLRVIRYVESNLLVSHGLYVLLGVLYRSSLFVVYKTVRTGSFVDKSRVTTKDWLSNGDCDPVVSTKYASDDKSASRGRNFGGNWVLALALYDTPTM